MTSTTALESKSIGVSSQTDDKLHRGRNVVLAFLMQGELVPGEICMIGLMSIRLGSIVQSGSSYHLASHFPRRWKPSVCQHD